MSNLHDNSTPSTENSCEPRAAGCTLRTQVPPSCCTQPAARGFRPSLDVLDEEFLIANGRELLVDLLAHPVEAELSVVAEFLLTLELTTTPVFGFILPAAVFLEKCRVDATSAHKPEQRRLLARFVSQWDAARQQYEREQGLAA